MDTIAEANLRLDKEALFARLSYEPHPGQLAVHRSKAPRRILACGVRWGKSTVATFEVVAALLEPCEESLGWIVAPTFELTDRVFRNVREVLHQHLRHRIVDYEPQEHRIVVRNLGAGLSELRGKSADRAASLLGEGLNWVVVDEAARLKASVWEGHLSQRLIDRTGWALLVSTPRGKQSWFFDLYERGQGRDPDYASWRSPSWENPLLDRTVIERERDRIPELTFAQEFEARFTGDKASHCESCGGPRIFGAPVAFFNPGETPGTCSECQGEIGPDGTSLMTWLPGERRLLEAIALRPERTQVVALPLPQGSDSLP